MTHGRACALDTSRRCRCTTWWTTRDVESCAGCGSRQARESCMCGSRWSDDSEINVEVAVLFSNLKLATAYAPISFYTYNSYPPDSHCYKNTNSLRMARRSGALCSMPTKGGSKNCAIICPASAHRSPMKVENARIEVQVLMSSLSVVDYKRP